MKQQLSHPMRLVCLFACILLFCGLTACANKGDPPDSQQAATEPTSAASASLPPNSEDMKDKLYPADVQTVTEDDPSRAGSKRQIIKTYILSEEDNPGNIPRDGFTLDGWFYELTDIKQSRTSGTDARPHTETMEIETDSNDLNMIIEQLSETLEYQSEDGYCGLLKLDLASVDCKASGYESSSYTVTVTREYASLPANDLYFIPKTITDNGRTLALDSVEWVAQTYVNVGYTDIPDSYRAIAKYTGKALQSVATGYVTTAAYTGEITKIVGGDTVYTAYFAGSEINPAPEESEVTPAPVKDSGSFPIAPIIGVAVIVALAVAAVFFFFLRHNVKVYSVREDGCRVLVAKVRIGMKNPVLDLTPLDGSESRCFGLEIDKIAAKSLNGKTVDVIFASAKLSQKIAYEGNPYQIEADFHDMTIKAIY